MGPVWNVTEYQRFGDERSRPFFDLTARIPDGPVARAVDLGCGTGALTATISDRWPSAQVTGVDRSPEMLAAAAAHARPGRLDFVLGDIARWRSALPVDLVVSNAALHWVPDHRQLLANLAEALTPGGRLAIQMPGNSAAPSHTEIRALCESATWRDRLGAAVPPDPVLPLATYVDQLFALGFTRVDAWETTYVHILQGDEAVLRWVKGTTLRPILAPLGPTEQERFLAELGARLRPHYPPGPHGTLFPFRRLFLCAILP